VSHVISVSILAVHFIILLFAFAWKYEFPVLSCYLHPGLAMKIRWELAKSQLTEEDCKTILWQALKFAI